MVFVSGSVYVLNYVYRLAYVEPALHPRDESYLIMMDKFFHALWQSASQDFIEDFCIYVHLDAKLDIGLKFSFLVESLPGFGIRMMLVS